MCVFFPLDSPYQLNPPGCIGESLIHGWDFSYLAREKPLVRKFLFLGWLFQGRTY